MKIAFFQPPAAQSAGGIAAAIHPLETNLQDLGHKVVHSLEDQPDLVHFHGLWQPAHLSLARTCRARGLPYLVSPHGMLEPWAFRSKRWKKYPYFFLGERPYLKRAAALLGTSPLEADHLREMVPGVRVVSLPLGLTDSARPDYLTARSALNWKPAEKILLYLSRVDRKKGLDILLQALAETSPPSARLVIVGGGHPAYLRHCHRLATQHAPTLPPIDWMGEVWGAGRWPFLQGADLFCLPTHSENFGLAVLEALQVGTPVLTTRHTPWPGFMEHQEGGYFCDSERESVRAALRQFGESPAWPESKRAPLAAWARGAFDWSALIPKYEALYREIAPSAHPRA